jgi:hypothetical protein
VSKIDCDICGKEQDADNMDECRECGRLVCVDCLFISDDVSDVESVCVLCAPEKRNENL